MWHTNAKRKAAFARVLDVVDVAQHEAECGKLRPYVLREESALLIGRTADSIIQRLATYHTQYPATTCVAWSIVDGIRFDATINRYTLSVRLLYRVWPWECPRWWKVEAHRLLSRYLAVRDRLDPRNYPHGTRIGIVRLCVWATMKLVCR